MQEPQEGRIELSAEEEQDCIRKTQQGDRAAFEPLVKAHMRRMYFVALALVRNHDDALDCSQEAFARAYRALNRFRLGAPFYPWIRRITRNQCLNFLKKERRAMKTSLDTLREDKGIEFPDDRPDPRAVAAGSEHDRLLWEAIGRLKPEFREILVLKHFEHLSYKEIAETLEIPIGTVMSRLFHARAALRDVLERSKFRQKTGEGTEGEGGAS